MTPIKLKYLFIGMLLSVSHTLIAQDSDKFQANTIIDIIPFELTSHNNISIKAVFGGIDTLNLMFHTAAGSIALTTEATEKMKSIQWNEQTDVRSWGGNATSRYSESNSMEIGKMQWDSLSIWEDENSGPTTGGKFGPNLFDGSVIEIDFDKNRMILHEALPNKVEEYLKMEIISENGYIFIQGTSTIGKEEYENIFLIHSGYGGALLYDDKFAADSKIGERIEILEEKELKDSFGNVVKVNKGSLPLFTIGNIELTDVPVGFFQGKIGRQQMSVLGGDILKRFNLIVDLTGGFIYMKENKLKEVAYTEF